MSLIRPQPVIYIENIVVILIVITLIVSRLAGLCQYAAGIVRRFVFELRITDAIRVRDIEGQLTQRLKSRDDHSSV